ncbi:unnamed protein product [Coffea canephora]|uniref:Uncharacterized protein n=1 Tax=Coffea canephora TaxID=49390 RepID=A0A068TRE7_COFCA|nr:unnamed protein product [Coffea canephora]
MKVRAALAARASKAIAELAGISSNPFGPFLDIFFEFLGIQLFQRFHPRINGNLYEGEAAIIASMLCSILTVLDHAFFFDLTSSNSFFRGSSCCSNRILFHSCYWEWNGSSTSLFSKHAFTVCLYRLLPAASKSKAVCYCWVMPDLMRVATNKLARLFSK